MRLSYQSGGYALSTLRSYLACDGSGFNTASSMRGQFFGYAGTGNMSFAANSWIMRDVGRLLSMLVQGM